MTDYSLGLFRASGDMLAATLEALLDDRDYSPWSPVIAGWHQWFAHASEVV